MQWPAAAIHQPSMPTSGIIVKLERSCDLTRKGYSHMTKSRACLLKNPIALLKRIVKSSQENDYHDDFKVNFGESEGKSCIIICNTKHFNFECSAVGFTRFVHDFQNVE